MTGKAAREIVIRVTREPSPQRDAELARWASVCPDWDEVVALATAHGVLPYLAATVRQAAWAGMVPEPVRHHLRLREAASALAQVACLDTLRPVFTALEARGLDLLVLKGPALACALYPRPGLRGFRDLDLLCQPDQMEAADAVLRALGYARCAQGPSEHDGFHEVYERPDGVMPIELHVDPLQLGLPVRSLPGYWAGARAVTMGTCTCRMPELHHQLVHLCVHLHTHGYGRLIWFKDLDLLLRRHADELDWSRVHAIANAEGVSLCVRHALILLARLLETPLPEAALRDGAPDLLGEAAHALLWPAHKVVALQSKQRLRALRFNPRQGVMGVAPNLVVLGRRREKLAALLAGRAQRTAPAAASAGEPGAWRESSESAEASRAVGTVRARER